MATSNSPQDWLRLTLHEARPWISECLSKHSACRETQPRIIPTRLIDVGPSDGSRDPFLFVPSAHCYAPPELKETWAPTFDASFRYLALSYCWGDQGNLLTTPDNYDARKAGIAWDEIPQTIKDAILVTRKLGFGYLWVDALCIIQGAGGDWATESPKMAEIYGGAFLTISAAISPRVQHGFLQILEKSIAQNIRSLRQDKNPLYYRGWALQERILSRRVLIFSDRGLFWECQDSGYQASSITRRRCEVYYPTILSDVGRRLCKAACSREDWTNVVDDYTRRSLTLKRDTFPALSGLAKLYQQFTKHEYLAGLWKETLLLDLLWKSDWPYSVPIPESAWHSKDPAPSWSWASAVGVVRSFSIFPSSIKPLTAKVLNAQIELKDAQAPFGEVLSGSIVLCGPLIPESEVQMPVSTIWKDERRTSTEGQQSQPKVWYLLLAIEYNSKSWGHGLILEGGKGIDQSCFARIGVFETLPWSDDKKASPGAASNPFEDCTHSTITII